MTRLYDLVGRLAFAAINAAAWGIIGALILPGTGPTIAVGVLFFTFCALYIIGKDSL